MNASTLQYLADQTFPARLDQLSAIGELITAVARQLNMGNRDVFAVQMAVDEAATNIIVHGFADQPDGSLQLICWQEGSDLVIQIRDRGQQFDPDEVPEPDLHTSLEDRQEGGLGIFLMRRMMDRVEFTQEGDENVLTMARHCTPSAGLVAGTALVTPKGRIDATTSPQLERMLRGPIEAAQRFVLVDLSQVTYLSSSGLRVLLIAAKELDQHDGNLILCCLQPSVNRVLRMTGFGEILPLYQTREAALQAMDSMRSSAATG
jgi:anti-anti-sigma factor